MSSHNKQVPINMRVAPEKVRLIDIAAELEGVNRTQFVLGAATARAEDILLNGTDKAEKDKKFNDFVAALDTYSPM